MVEGVRALQDSKRDGKRSFPIILTDSRENECMGFYLHCSYTSFWCCIKERFTSNIVYFSHIFKYWNTMKYIYYQISYYTGLFISPSGISEFDCATTKTDTAERSISIGRESLQVSVLPYRCSICAPLVTRQMSIKFLRHALQRVSQELDYRIDICRVTKGAHIEHL